MFNSPFNAHMLLQPFVVQTQGGGSVFSCVVVVEVEILYGYFFAFVRYTALSWV